NKGWVKTNENVEEMDKDALAQEKASVYAGWVATLVPLEDKEFQLSLVGEAKVGDRPAVGVKVSHKGQKDINLYFDQEKGILLKMETRVKDMQGQEVTQETLYSDFKDFDGIKHPTKASIKRDGNRFVEIEWTELKRLDKLDDSVLAKP